MDGKEESLEWNWDHIPDELAHLAPTSPEALDAMLQKGYDDMLAGRTKPVKELFDDLRQKYGI